MSWFSTVRGASKKSGSAKGTTTSHRRASTRPELEPLEDRTVPAAISLQNGVVTYQAGAGETNNLTVSRKADMYTFRDTGADITSIPPGFTRSDSQTVRCSVSYFNQIVVRLGDRADTMNLTGSWVPVTIFGGSEADQVNIGNGYLDSVRGLVTVNGESGQDSVRLMDQSSTVSHTYTLSPSAGAGGRRDASGAITAFGGLVSSSVESLTLDADQGDSIVTMLSTPSCPHLAVNGGDGNDTVYVGNGTIDNNTGAVFEVNGQGDNDTVIVRDSSSLSAGRYGVTAEGITRTDSVSGGYSVRYSGSEAVTLNAAAGANTIDVIGTAAGTPVTLNVASGSFGADTVNIGSATSSLANIRGAVTVTGAARLGINDIAATAGQTYTLTGQTLARSGAALITFNDPYSLRLTGSAFADVLNVRGWPNATGPVRSTEVVVDLMAGANRVTGPDSDTRWRFEDDGTRQVNLRAHADAMSDLTVTGVFSVTGGSGRDFFEVLVDGFLPGNLNGGGGVNMLDYTWYDLGDDAGDRVWTRVNLSATANGGTATGVGGLVTNIRTVLGSDGRDDLTGGPAGSILLGFGGNDSLTGGGSNDVLIGDVGGDTLTSGGGNDVLIGDDLDFPNSWSAYGEQRVGDAMFDIWQRTTASNYASQVALLRDEGVMVDGEAHWLDRSAVTDDGADDHLIGALPSPARLDWFFASPNDTLVNFSSPEVVT